MEIKTNIQVSLRSGAGLTLTEAQNKQIHSFVKQLVLGEIKKEKTPTVRSYKKRTYKKWTPEEDQMIQTALSYSNRDRVKAFHQIAFMSKRTMSQISNRAWEIKKRNTTTYLGV